jgi:hypothetical protein
MLAVLNGRLESFIEVRASEARMRLAQTAAEEAARVLGIPVPAIRFFYRSRFDSVIGYASSSENEIAIAADLNEVETMKTVVHECRHMFQFRSDKWAGRSTEIRERDAALFEAAWPSSPKDLIVWRAAGFGNSEIR